VPLVGLRLETSAKSHFVILSEAKDLVFTYSYEILRSLRSLRMTKAGIFAEVSTWYKSALTLSVPPLEKISGRALPVYPN
jgi:hypothetical protein